MTATLCPPGVDLDVARSTITLDGRTYPAGLVLTGRDPFNCPIEGGGSPVCRSCAPFAAEQACVWGGASHMDDPAWGNGWQVLIPTESGCLFMVSYDCGCMPGHGPDCDKGLKLSLIARNYSSKTMEIQWLRLVGRQLLPDTPGRLMGLCMWDACDPEWLADTIDRVGQFPVTQPDGPPVRWVPLNDPRVTPVAVRS
jgi:hypothetical protein